MDEQVVTAHMWMNHGAFLRVTAHMNGHGTYEWSHMNHHGTFE